MRRLGAVAGAAVLLAGAALAQPSPMPAMPGMTHADAKPAAPNPGVLTIKGFGGHSEVLKPADIAALPHETATLAHGGKTTTYSGPLLSDLLHDVDAPMGSRIHGHDVNDVVEAVGADGYRITMALADVDPSFHQGAKVIVADRADGMPLDPHEGPFRLVIAGDQKAARSVHGLVEVDLKRLP